MERSLKFEGSEPYEDPWSEFERTSFEEPEFIQSLKYCIIQALLSCRISTSPITGFKLVTKII